MLTPQHIAKALSLHTGTIRRYLAEGQFPQAIHIGNRWRIPEQDLQEFLAKYAKARTENQTPKRQ